MMRTADDVTQALLRADLWRILALCFATPAAQTLADIRQLCNGLISTLAGSDHPLQEGLIELADTVAKLDVVELEHEHNALFSMDVLVPAYEGSYQRIERGSVIGDVAGFYRAFDLAPVDHSGPPDSLWNELAFVTWLSIKQAFALEQGMTDAAGITRDAMVDFLSEHLGRWTGAFSQRLLATTGNPLYCTGAHLLLATVSLVTDDLGIERIVPLEPRTMEGDAEPVACPVGCAEAEDELITPTAAPPPLVS